MTNYSIDNYNEMLKDVRNKVDASVDERVTAVTQHLTNNLKHYAGNHRRTGKLEQAIHFVRVRDKGEGVSYNINAGNRSDYGTQTSYPPLFFSTYRGAKIALTRYLREANNELQKDLHLY